MNAPTANDLDIGPTVTENGASHPVLAPDEALMPDETVERRQ